MISTLQEHWCDGFDAAARALTRCLAEGVRARLRNGARTVLAVGGGRTPRLILPMLAATDCGWSGVTVTLTDDRSVAPDDPASNAGLVRSCLLRDFAAEASFAGLDPKGTAAPPQPDLMYLGFGEDGHVASLFPGGPELAAAHLGVVPARAPVAPRDRISLTMPTLLAAARIVILVSGAAKHDIYRRARDEAADAGLPLARVLRQSATPVEAFLDSAG